MSTFFFNPFGKDDVSQFTSRLRLSVNFPRCGSKEFSVRLARLQVVQMLPLAACVSYLVIARHGEL